MFSRHYLRDETIKSLNGNMDAYYSMIDKSGPERNYSYFELVDQEVFFDWCDQNGFSASGNEILVDTPGLKDIKVAIGRYVYGPKPGYLVFSYN